MNATAILAIVASVLFCAALAAWAVSEFQFPPIVGALSR